MKTVIINLTHQFETEVHQEAEGKARVFELLCEGYPIRSTFYDKESNTVCIHFACKGAEVC